MKFLIFFFIIFLYSKTVLANVTHEIIKKLNETENITFNFEQTTSEQSEIGKCFLVFSGNLKCIYEGDEKKEVLVRNNSLYIIKHKFKRSYRYPLKNSAFNIILDKKKLLENLKLIDQSKIKQTSTDYFYELNTESGLIAKIFFDKKTNIIKGWETVSYNQETVKFKILEPQTNLKIEEEFKVPDYNF